MGKKKSSSSKKQQSLAAAVEQAEQQVDELKLDDDTKQSEGKTGKKEGNKKVKTEVKDEEEEFEFDYTGGENMTEENDKESQGLLYILFQYCTEIIVLCKL